METLAKNGLIQMFIWMYFKLTGKTLGRRQLKGGRVSFSGVFSEYKMETLIRNGLNLYRTLNRYFRSRLVLLYFVVILLSLSFASFKFEFGNASKNSKGLLEVFVTVLWHEPNISSYKILCDNFRLNRLFNYWFLF